MTETFWLCGYLNGETPAIDPSTKLPDKTAAALEGFGRFREAERVIVARCTRRNDGKLINEEMYEVPRAKAVRFIPFPDLSRYGF